MKIILEQKTDINETEIIIRFKEKDAEVDKILSTFDLMNKNIIAKDANGNNFIVDPANIFYFESIDDKVFCYTNKEVYETKYKLYELETILENSSFIRINKNSILNTAKILSFKSTINGRMEAVLKNKEKVEISRNYVQSLKNTLGGKK